MSEPLYDDMIRIVTDHSTRSHAKNRRPYKVYVGHHTLKDKRGQQRRFGSRMMARAAAREFITEHNQANLPAPTDDECRAIVEAFMPECLVSMGCLCAGHARGNLANDPCDTSEEPKREVSTEAFDAALIELIDEASASELLAIPGLYEIVSEFYNNEAIDLAKGE